MGRGFKSNVCESNLQIGQAFLDSSTMFKTQFEIPDRQALYHGEASLDRVSREQDKKTGWISCWACGFKSNVCESTMKIGQDFLDSNHDKRLVLNLPWAKSIQMHLPRNVNEVIYVHEVLSNFHT